MCCTGRSVWLVITPRKKRKMKVSVKNKFCFFFTFSTVAGDSSEVEDDIEWYRQEVGEEPDPGEVVM